MTIDKIMISGLGSVSCAGNDSLAVRNNFNENKTISLDSPTLFQTLISSPVFEIKGFEPEIKESRTLSLALYAAKKAICDASLDLTDSELKIGVCLGTTVGCMFQSLEFYKNYKDRIQGDFKCVKDYLFYEPAQFLKKYFHLNGPAITITTACASGSNAIGTAMELIRQGHCDIVIAGGADALDIIPYTGFNSLFLLSSLMCNPFDRNRKGLNLGEGSAFLILESEKVLKKRGFQTDLFLAGYGTFADGHHLTGPHPEGRYLEEAILKAIEQAGIKPFDIGYVNAHGTATKDNDKIEGQTLKRIFGNQIKFSSTKHYTGHTLGAAGALEAFFCCIGLKSGCFPGNPAFQEPDPEIELSPLTSEQKIDTSFVLSTSLGFGGVNAALVLGKMNKNGS